MKRYNLSNIMHKAWAIFRRGKTTFSEALHRAWMVAKVADQNTSAVNQAKAAAGISEKVHTWADWKALGQEVIHGSKALFQVLLLTPDRGENATYKASYFGYSQVAPAE